MHKDGRSTTLKNLINILLGNFRLALHDDLVTLNGNHLTGILIDEVLIPALQYTGCQVAANHLLHILLINLHFLSKVKDLKDVLISLKADSTQQCGHGQLLLSVDVSIHHIVDVSGKLNPRTLERDDTCTVKHGTIGMDALTEEHTR